MKLRNLAGAMALALMISPALAQVTPGTSPLTGAKGGTNNAFMQFAGPATSMKTYTLPNASGTIDLLNAAQTFTAAKTFADLTLLLAGSTSGTTTLKASATASGTLTFPAATDTIVGKATTDTFTNKTFDTAGAGNSLLINGLAATANTGTGAVCRATSPALTTPTISPSATIAMGVDTATALLITGLGGNGRLSIGADTSNGFVRSNNSGQLKFGIDATDTAALESNGVFSVGTAGSLGNLKLYGNTSGSTLLRPQAAASGTLTLPAATDTLVGKATTDTLTNKTFDSGGTGNTLQVSGVTVSRGQFPGVNSNTAATTGNIGEYPTPGDVAIGSAVALTVSASPFNVTSISLGAGDWDVSALCGFTGNAATTVTQLTCSLSTTAATLDTSNGRLCTQSYNNFTVFNNGSPRITCGPDQFIVSGPTTVNLVAQAAFGVSTAAAFGKIRARRPH